MFYEDLLHRFTEMSRAVLGENLIGVYLHGSLAMGCFNPQKSDLDLILVVEEEISAEIKRRFAEKLLQLNEEAPEKGFELSIVRRAVCKPFVYPTPYLFHYSNGWRKAAMENMEKYIADIQGTDKDLGAHFTILNRYGIPLYGPPVEEIFAPVPKQDYFDSIWFDVQNAAQDILESPVYIVLNLCRVLGYVRDDLVLSKSTGGEWGMEHLPATFRGLVEAALQSYTSNAEMTAKDDELRAFAAYMIEEIKRVWTADPQNVTGAMLTDMGICPTCYSRAHRNCFFPNAAETQLFENDRFECSLVDKPRAPGHTVIVSRDHYKDMMSIPEDLCVEVYRFARKAMQILKEVYGAESVYLCTMCDGPMNHFHVQLIPRYAHEKRGSRNFVKPRQAFSLDTEKIRILREKLKNA